MTTYISARGIGIAACAAALLLLAIAVIGGGALADGKAAPTVSGAWVKLPAVPGRPAAAYATIRAGGSDDRLIGIEVPQPARAELHATRNDGGVMRMAAMKALDIGANGEVVLKPGGMHVMLFDLAGATKPGMRVPLTFVFEKAGRVTATAHARAAGDDAGAHHH